MALLDTTMLIDLLRKPNSGAHARAAQKVLALKESGQTLTTTRLNVAEIFVGVELAADPQAEELRARALLLPIRVLELDEVAGRRFASITAYLKKKGLPSGDIDVFIAGIALVHGQTIITRNVKHFVQIPGLTVESY